MPTAVLDPLLGGGPQQPVAGVSQVPPKQRWTRKQFYRMVDASVFEDRADIELIDGEIIKMSPQGSKHYSVIEMLEDALRPLNGPTHYVRMQGPLSFGPDVRPSDPIPDASVVSGKKGDYVDHHPATALLVVEVGESSLPDDRGWRSSLYASRGIQEYWIIDVVRSFIEVRRNPIIVEATAYGMDYADRRTHSVGASVSSLIDPSLELPVNSFFPWGNST